MMILIFWEAKDILLIDDSVLCKALTKLIIVKSLKKDNWKMISKAELF